MRELYADEFEEAIATWLPTGLRRQRGSGPGETSGSSWSPRLLLVLRPISRRCLSSSMCRSTSAKTVRTTNPIERVFREVRRRTRTISCFTNRRIIDRMLYAVLAYQNEQWDEAYRPKQFTHNSDPRYRVNSIAHYRAGTPAVELATISYTARDAVGNPLSICPA